MSESYQGYDVPGFTTLYRCPMCGALVLEPDIELHDRSHRVWPLYEKGD